MSAATIKEKCSCGATFEYTGYASTTVVGDWRRTHRHEPPPAPKPEPYRGNTSTSLHDFGFIPNDIPVEHRRSW